MLLSHDKSCREAIIIQDVGDLGSLAYAGFFKGGCFREQIPRCRARPEKVAERGGGGGLRHIFFFSLQFFTSFTLLGRGTVRLPDRPPGWKKKKKKNYITPNPPPPPCVRACLGCILFIHVCMCVFVHILYVFIHVIHVFVICLWMCNGRSVAYC